MEKILLKTVMLSGICVGVSQPSYCMVVHELDDAINEVDIKVGNGSIYVTPGDHKGQTLEYRFIKGSQADCQISYEISDRKVSLIAESVHKGNQPDLYEIAVDVHMQDPRAVTLMIANGNATIEHLQTVANIDVARGSVEVNAPLQDLSINVGSGHIAVTDIAGDMTANLGNGDFFYTSHGLQAPTQKVSVEQGNGQMSLFFPSDAIISQNIGYSPYSVQYSNPYPNIDGAPYEVYLKLGAEKEINMSIL